MSNESLNNQFYLFEEIIKGKKDEELIQILTQQNDYQPEFIDLVKNELIKIRNSDLYKDYVKSKSETNEWEKWYNSELQEDSEKIKNNPFNLSHIASQLLFNEKQSKDDVIKELIIKGLTTDDAITVVDSLITRHNEDAKEDMKQGAIWCVTGIIVSAATYSFASGGGIYIIACGPIIYGAIKFIKGANDQY